MPLLVPAYVADLIFGDPEWFPHPVRGMGKLITLLDRLLRGCRVGPAKNQSFSDGIERTKGVIAAFVVVGISACCAYSLMKFSTRLNPLLGSLVWVYLGCASLATKDLRVKAKAIYREIEKGSIAGARKQLSKIVGRDTENLSEERIVTATIESVAENTNDGIIAPLFYLILGGPVSAIAYKSINTLDSMIGHRDEKYLHFGWFSAKLDDIANYVPARISGFLISISSLIVGGRGFRKSFRTMLRDGRKHLSPNSGISEAAMAGALGVRLGGILYYRGRVSVTPHIGDAKRVIQPSIINEALSISLITSILMVSIGAILKWLI
jgi:adenosylcobinamide-phosphate synthase